jgi:isocitrate dehydrogenase (NAD+)
LPLPPACTDTDTDIEADNQQLTSELQPVEQKMIPATLIPGDGIGPEIVESIVLVLDALGAPFVWEVHQAGMAGVEAFGDPLPRSTLDSIWRTRLALKGPLTTPVGGGYRSSNVRLREEFHLYANVRPALTLVPGGRYEDIDVVLVRENLEGLYVGFEHYIPIDDDPRAVAVGSGINTRAGCRRIAEFAFEYAVRNGRKKVTIVHKANILKALTGLFLETAQEVGKRYAGRLQVDDRIVDACPCSWCSIRGSSMSSSRLTFSAIFCRTRFPAWSGDWGWTRRPTLAWMPRFSRPCMVLRRISRGKGVANPLALLLAAAMMLDHVGRNELAQPLRKAIRSTLNDDNVRTRDLGGTASTTQFAQAILRQF